MNKDIFMMKLKTTMVAIAISMAFVSQQAAAANPASTDYVQNYVSNNIEQAKNTLRFKLNEAVPGGVVFYTDSTKLHGMIVAYTDAKNYAELQPYNCHLGITPNYYSWNFSAVGLNSGVGNLASMVALNLVAGSKCRDVGPQMQAFSVSIDDPTIDCSNIAANSTTCLAGWVIGSKGDMEVLMQNIDSINESLVQNGGTALSGTYWTSSESLPGFADTAKAWAINAVQGQLAFEALQTTEYKSRGIRYF